MQQISDTIQTLLALPFPAKFLAAFCIVLILRVVLRITGKVLSIGLSGLILTYSFLKGVFYFSLSPFAVLFAMLKIGVLAALLCLVSDPVRNALQYCEQAFISPVYFSPDTSSATQAVYEGILARNVGRSEYNAIMIEAQYLAGKYGSSVLAFLQVYHAECGLNPYAACVNKQGDTVAIGIIQFTAAGVDGLANWREVKKKARARDITYLLQLQRTYFERAAPCALPRPCDVYAAVFMPSFVCAQSDETALASINSDKPQWYHQNPSLDGYKIDEKGRIFVGDKYRDGKITKKDLALKLEYLRQQITK